MPDIDKDGSDFLNDTDMPELPQQPLRKQEQYQHGSDEAKDLYVGRLPAGIL